jgi:hypothetical protein
MNRAAIATRLSPFGALRPQLGLSAERPLKRSNARAPSSIFMAMMSERKPLAVELTPAVLLPWYRWRWETA